MRGDTASLRCGASSPCRGQPQDARRAPGERSRRCANFSTNFWCSEVAFWDGFRPHLTRSRSDGASEHNEQDRQ